MNKLILSFILLLGCSFVHAQSIIDPALQDEMNLRDDKEKIEIVILMKAQCDRTELNNRARFCSTRAIRRDYVVSEMKAFAEASQSDLKHTLADMELQGLTTTPKTLWMSNAVSLSANKTAIQGLARRNDIAVIGYSQKHYALFDEEAKAASATREITPNVLQVNADKVWELGYRGQGVVVAVVDTGVNYDHHDLADHVWDGGEAFPHHGYDVINDDDDPMDDMLHGTHCAGTVCGDGTAGSITGSAPDASLMCIKSLDSTGSGTCESIASGMEWAVEHGCDVLSMSTGFANVSAPEKELLRRTCEATMDAGVAAAVANGNEGSFVFQMVYPIPNNVRIPGSCPPPYLDPDQLENPGGKSCVIAIGAVDANDVAAGFSSQGPVTWQDTEYGDYAYEPGIGLIRPDVCAPGVQIKSLDYSTVDGYSVLDGTSMAAPCVAGVIALMLNKNPELMPADICQILEESSVKLTEHKSNVTGVGRVDALAAIEMVSEWDNVAESNGNKTYVYPNPTRDRINVECSGMKQINVFSMDGRLIRSIVAQQDAIQIGALERGIYVLQIVKENETMFQKIIKY